MAVGTRFLSFLDTTGVRRGLAVFGTLGLVAVALLSGNASGSTEPLTPAPAALSEVPTTAPLVASGTSLSPTTTAPKRLVAPSQCGDDSKGSFGCPIFIDDFDGTSIDTGDTGWSVYDYPTSSFPRVAQNFRVADGSAQLKGTYDRSSGSILGAGVASKVNQKYGRWEVRMRVDQGRGYSAASLLWPTTEKWPSDGEIDLFEIPKSDRSSVFTVVHNGARNIASSNKLTMDATQWHTYAVEWTPSKLIYFIDGKQVWSVTKANAVPSTATMKLTLQMDPGTKSECGRWFECPDGSTPASTTMYVDSVKIWAYNG